MSINATNWVWTLTDLPNATVKLVLMKYADHAHDDGTHTWQSISKVATYALCSERTAQRAVAWLVEHGFMREGDQSVIPDHYDPRRRPIAYELAMGETTRLRWEVENAAGPGARRDAAHAAGKRGAEKRAEAKAQVATGDNLSPQEVQSSPPKSTGVNLSPQDAESRGDNQSPGGVTNEPVRGDTGVTQTTQTTTPENHPISSSEPLRAPDPESESGEIEDRNKNRDDVDRLCQHLAQRLIENDCKAPTIGVRWRDAARLMLDTDGRTEQQVHNMIEWATRDAFWRANILSMPTLREKYDQMRLRAMEEAEKGSLRRGGYDDVATWGDRTTPAEQDAQQAVDHAAAIREAAARNRSQQPPQTGTAG